MIEIGDKTIEAIFTHAAAAHPQECCGLLLGEAGKIAQAQPTRNVHPDPTSHFELDPRALIEAHKAARAGGPQVIGYYHSHPAGRPEPSATDRALAAHDGKVWAIVADGEIAFFRDGEDRFEPLSYSLQPR